MKYTILKIILPILFIFNVNCQEKLDKKKADFGMHLGVNFQGGFAGGTYGGGGIGFSPRIGLNYKKRVIFGLEYNANYQIVYLKDSLESQSILLSKWFGPFLRYYFFDESKKWNAFGVCNYTLGSLFVSSPKHQFIKKYDTFILGLGGSYKIKNTLIELGYRYTFLLGNTPIEARWQNTLFIGISRNF